MPSAGFDSEFKESLAKFKQQLSFTNAEGKTTTFLDEALITEVHSYIFQQLNDIARMGVIDINQYKLMSSESLEGLFTLVYVKNYKVGEDLIDKDSLYISASNFTRLLFSRVLGGRDREIVLRDIDSKQQKVVMGNR